VKRALLVLLVACGGKGPTQTVPAPPPQNNVVETKPMPPPPPPPPQLTQTATPQELQFPNEDFRAHQPAAGAPRPFKLPKVQHFALKNGIQVYLVEQHNLPLVSMNIDFDGGGMGVP
jgi:hypothetical protein